MSDTAAPDAQRRAEATHATIARSASHLEHSATAQLDNAARSTQLAADRTILAAERTYAAWVRTGLAALASGIGARALLHGVVTAPLPAIAGVTLSGFSAFCFLAAVWREMAPSWTTPAPEVRRLPAGLLIAVNGVLVLVSLAAMYGVLASR